jgi:tRNA-splicing ligase RtcB
MGKKKRFKGKKRFGGGPPAKGGALPSLDLERVDDCRWRIPAKGGMRVDGMIYADDTLMADIRQDNAMHQVANVAHLPGIVHQSMAMPDIHWGYGFPIGGVAAVDAEQGGVVSPGGIGFDINCGVRLLATDLTRDDILPRAKEIADALYDSVPSGVGSHRRDHTLSEEDAHAVCVDGAKWAVEAGFGLPQDLDHIEEGGRIDGAKPENVSARAFARGRKQLGTLGSGNHFVEVGWVDQIRDAAAAEALGLREGQVTVIVHTGSRGFGYQVCDDHLDLMVKAAGDYGIELPDRQLCCAPLGSPEANQYLGAMFAAANYAFANRQLITHFVRKTLQERFGTDPAAVRLIYDLCHNIGKFETHAFEGQDRRLFVHRKGATRAFPPGRAEVPAAFRGVGQPVLIPGDMGRYSFVLMGTATGAAETFGSTCHGAGRVLSRGAARRAAKGRNILQELAGDGIYVRGASVGTVVEEMPEAYKDVADVVGVVERADISKIVARLRPLAVVKG